MFVSATVTSFCLLFYFVPVLYFKIVYIDHMTKDRLRNATRILHNVSGIAVDTLLVGYIDHNTKKKKPLFGLSRSLALVLLKYKR